MIDYVINLVIREPVRSIAESAPWVKLAGPPIGAVLAFVWGEAFVFLCLLYASTALWDWILGGQIAARRTRAAEAAGQDPTDWGGFDSEVARAGLLVKVSLLVQIGIIYVGELWVASTFGLTWSVILPPGLAELAPSGEVTVLSAVLMVAAVLNELRSCERNRRVLGGREIPLLSHAMDLLDRLADRLVPHQPGQEDSWEPLPPARSKRHLRPPEGPDA